MRADFKPFPGENFATLAAGIRSRSPVRGFLPVLAFRLPTKKVPKFTKLTRFPFFNEVVTAVVKVSKAFPAATFVTPAEDAIFAINSSLVICPPFVRHSVKGEKSGNLTAIVPEVRRPACLRVTRQSDVPAFALSLC